MHLRERLSNAWNHVQTFLFPLLREEIGPLTPLQERLAVVIDMVDIDAHVRNFDRFPGRPLQDRRALARAFIAKAVMNISTTAALVERLAADRALRRLCGWECASAVPSEATFSRAFAGFARSSLPSLHHEALIARTHKSRLVGHVSRDSTAIEAREKPKKATAPKDALPKRGRGRPRKGEAVTPKEPKRLDRQAGMTLQQMLDELPKACAVGAKFDAKGNLNHWIGYKLNIDTVDGDIPVSCLLTSASLHGSQAALPLMEMTAARMTSLYDLMDAAYDAPQIWDKSRALGHVPIIAQNPRKEKAVADIEALAKRRAGFIPPEAVRLRELGASERVNSALKDNYGARNVRVRGHDKVLCRLMFGVAALAAEQIMRLVT